MNLNNRVMPNLQCNMVRGIRNASSQSTYLDLLMGMVMAALKVIGCFLEMKIARYDIRNETFKIIYTTFRRLVVRTC